jgi:hypothetical protein
MRHWRTSWLHGSHDILTGAALTFEPLSLYERYKTQRNRLTRITDSRKNTRRVPSTMFWNIRIYKGPKAPHYTKKEKEKKGSEIAISASSSFDVSYRPNTDPTQLNSQSRVLTKTVGFLFCKRFWVWQSNNSLYERARRGWVRYFLFKKRNNPRWAVATQTAWDCTTKLRVQKNRKKVCVCVFVFESIRGLP